MCLCVLVKCLCSHKANACFNFRNRNREVMWSPQPSFESHWWKTRSSDFFCKWSCCLHSRIFSGNCCFAYFNVDSPTVVCGTRTLHCLCMFFLLMCFARLCRRVKAAWLHLLLHLSCLLVCCFRSCSRVCFCVFYLWIMFSLYQCMTATVFVLIFIIFITSICLFKEFWY